MRVSGTSKSRRLISWVPEGFVSRLALIQSPIEESFTPREVLVLVPVKTNKEPFSRKDSPCVCVSLL